MNLTRRDLAAVIISVTTPAAAQTPQPPVDEVQAARERIKANGDALSKLAVPMSTEPAFQFKV